MKVFLSKGDLTKSESAILLNGYCSSPMIYLSDEHLLKEYYEIVTKVALFTNLANFPFEQSFFFQKTKKALIQRGFVSKLFLTEDLRMLTSQMLKIVQRNLKVIRN